MKIKLLSVLLLLVLGVAVLLMVVSGFQSVEQEYNTNLTRARENAQKQIPYNAYHYYQAAFEIRCEDESVYQEYLAQAQALGSSFYKTAVQEYVERFPESATAYELLCQVYYESRNYSLVMSTALEARAKGVATEQVKDWYNECAYMLKDIKTGLEEAQTFLGGYALVKVNGRFGYLSSNGNYLLAPIYPEASTMMGSTMAVNDGEEWFLINTAGYKVARTSEPVDYMGILVGGKIPIAVDGKYAYVNTSFTIPEELPYDFASNYKNGVAAVKVGEKWALIDSDEALITDYIFEDVLLDEYGTCYNGGVIFAKYNGKYYMVNSQGARISEQAFDDAKPFLGSEFAAVCIDGKWGFVNTSGAIVIDPQYEDANSFSIGLGAVCVDGLWGYINTSGTIRIECQFEACLPFSSTGIAAVKENGYWKYVRLFSYYYS